MNILERYSVCFKMSNVRLPDGFSFLRSTEGEENDIFLYFDSGMDKRDDYPIPELSALFTCRSLAIKHLLSIRSNDEIKIQLLKALQEDDDDFLISAVLRS